jgi:transposase
MGIEHIYYQDESGFDEYFTRRYGYSHGGTTVHTQLSGKKYERQSIMSLSDYQQRLVEPMIYQFTANSEVVLSYFELVLPQLTTPSVIILDNASYHKSKELQSLFHTYGHTLMFLPPYSPDLNPIEHIWGTIKQQLRSYYDYTISLFENLCKFVNQYSV